MVGIIYIGGGVGGLVCTGTKPHDDVGGGWEVPPFSWLEDLLCWLRAGGRDSVGRSGPRGLDVTFNL